MSGDTLLQVQNLKKYFDTPHGALHAVDDISFTLYRGQTLGIVGESGCGKSTLGRTILRLLPSTDGSIFFDGKDITSVEKMELYNLRREMQLIFQDPFASLDPKMTVSQIIAEPLKVQRFCKSRQECQSRVMELMEIVGLDSRYANTYPHELDGGRRQRIGIARALALEPKFIVCDEPVSALDVSIQAQILNLLMDLKDERGLTYLFITHDLSVVKHISDNILVLYMGKMVELTSSDRLFENPLHPYTKALLSAIPIPELSAQQRKVVAIQGEITSPINPPAGCRFAKRCPQAKDICFKAQPEFREVEAGHFVACHFVEERP